MDSLLLLYYLLFKRLYVISFLTHKQADVPLFYILRRSSGVGLRLQEL